MTDKQKLYAIIDTELSNPCEDTYPSICTYLKGEQGRQYIRQTVFELAVREGLSVGQAMAQVESDLPSFE